MAGELDDSQDEIVRAFWAIELVPGKEFSTEIPAEAELHITSAVLPASAKDAGRSVVSVTFPDQPDKTFSIVSLRLDSNDSQLLNVRIDSDSQVKFTVSGKNPVHLSGYYIPEEGPEGLYDDEDIDSDEVGDDGEMEFDDDDVDSDIDEETQKQVQAALAAQAEKKRKALAQQNGGENKKAKAEGTPQQQQPKKQQQQQQQQQQNQSTPKQQEAKKPQQQGGQQKTPQQKALPNGLKYTITQEGKGTEATKGKKVGVKYIGRLTKNNKVFDASPNKPFVFTLGAREVITGWDLGVAGMKVGEKRTLVIPPDLAYGSKGAGGDIPPNSSLTFDVELAFVK